MAGTKSAGKKTITMTVEELEELIDKRTKAAMKADRTIKHALTQDQIDLLSVVAPGKLARHEYEVVEPETV